MSSIRPMGAFVGESRQSAERVFAEALELTPEERQSFIDRVCHEDPDQKKLVEELLREDALAGSFLRLPITLSSQRVTTDKTASSPHHALAAEATARFRAGETIAQRFLVVRFIARGGMGEVYEVEDRLLQGNRVALKIILPEIAAHAESSRRFVQEVLLARKINHPNLCPIYEIFRCDEVPPPFLFLTMKLLTGETLERRLRNSILIPRDEALEIFHQMIAGITSIHNAGIVHRDIKPTNVMLDRSGLRLLVSIMDFGLARNYTSEVTPAETSVIAGTPGYLAPELLSGQLPSRASDLFALGVVLHQVLTGERPLKSGNGTAVEAAPSLATISVPMIYKQAVRGFLSTDPVIRCRAFEEYLGATNTRSAQPQSLGIWTRRRMLVVSGGVCCAIAGGAFWKRDTIVDHLHPLPTKRFVALVGWPPPTDTKIRPFLMNLIDSIASELARAEAYDQNLFLIPDSSSDVSTFTKLEDVRQSLGANLVLAASGIRSSRGVQLSLQVLPASSTRPLRTKHITAGENEELSLVNKAVRAAAALLDIHHYEPNDKRIAPGTNNPEAYAAFQMAESLRKQDNDTGLEAAIEKYKAAIDLDSRYTLALARLALAYCRLADVDHNPAATSLARANAQTALGMDPSLVPARMALAGALEQGGDVNAALREMKKALAVDPTNTETLTWLGQSYERMNRWQSAEECFRRALQLRPNDWLARNELGVLLYAQGKYLHALSEFQTAVLVSPKSAISQSNVGIMDLALGNFAEAVERLRMSLSLRRTALALSAMSAAFRGQHDPAAGLPFAREGTNVEAPNSSAWLELGDCESMLPEHESQARKAYAEGARVQIVDLQTNDKDGQGWILLSLCEAKTGAHEAARAHLRRGESMPSGDIDSQLYRARTLETLGQRDAALSSVAYCLRRGASTVQFDLMPEMKQLQADPRYIEIRKSLPTVRTA